MSIRPHHLLQNSERREERNARLRAEFDRVGEALSQGPDITEQDWQQLFSLLRIYHRREPDRQMRYLMQLVRDEQEGMVSPAVLELLDEIMSSDV